jgi:hypothetical protein
MMQAAATFSSTVPEMTMNGTSMPSSAAASTLIAS